MKEWICREISMATRDSENGILIRETELIRCKDCKYLNVINSNAVYARCEKHGIEFLPFEDDTRKCFCSWAERKEE